MSRRRRWSFANWCDHVGAGIVQRAHIRANRIMLLGQRWKKWRGR